MLCEATCCLLPSRQGRVRQSLLRSCRRCPRITPYLANASGFVRCREYCLFPLLTAHRGFDSDWLDNKLP